MESPCLFSMAIRLFTHLKLCPSERGGEKIYSYYYYMNSKSQEGELSADLKIAIWDPDHFYAIPETKQS